MAELEKIENPKKSRSPFQRRIIHGLIASGACLGIAIQVLAGIWEDLSNETMLKILGFTVIVSVCAYPIGFIWPLSEPKENDHRPATVTCNNCGESFGRENSVCPMCGTEVAQFDFVDPSPHHKQQW